MARPGGAAATRSAQGVVARVARALFKSGGRSGRRLTSRQSRAASGGSTNPFDLIPPRATRDPWRDGPNIDHGSSYSWVDDAGNRYTVRAHSADRSAPPGSNSANGPVYRVEVYRPGQRPALQYVGPDGRLYPASSLNPNHPSYDPRAADQTHIPWPGNVRPPWE